MDGAEHGATSLSMATMSALGSNGASSPSKTDSIREHELYRYYTPLRSPDRETRHESPDSYVQATTNTLKASSASSPDTTLTALAQLCAIRLQAQRAMISVIDKEKQYFLAEATKTLHLSDTSKSEVDGDDLWVGCTTVEKEGRLCEQTIKASAELGKYPMFTVCNLEEDPRFKDLPFVRGAPYFKFYAGTPLTTKRGINIGSLFVLDDKARPPLTDGQVDLIGTLALSIMKHMELSSEAEERKKILRLSMGMNAFVEGKHQIVPDLTHETTSGKCGKDEGLSAAANRQATKAYSLPQAKQTEPGVNAQRTPDFNAALAKEHPNSDNSQDDSDNGTEAQTTTDTSHRSTLARAGNIMYDALDIHGHGGVVFFDTTTRRRHETESSTKINSTDLTAQPEFPAEVLSSSTKDTFLPSNTQDNVSKSFTPLSDKLLHIFLRRYPRGKLWSFDGDAALSSSEEDAVSPVDRRRSGRSEQSHAKRKTAEAAALRKHFPEVKQLLFYGLWDAGSSRWFTAGFAWTTSSRQLFSVETELSFFMAFGNSVMAQVSRLASMASDRQKADFIGSISHELRSPLHGILASAEFLADSDQDAFHQSLIDTISSCGRTLLDTINHILDYSKINSFERNWRNTKKPRSKARATVKNARIVADKEAPPMLNIYATTDIASITEEVIEGVYAGQIYQDISSTEATDFSTAAKAAAVDRGIKIGTSSRNLAMTKEVEVVLDIAHEDYVFVTQPGALKRVIMNIFGNALKYTQKGTIQVSLSLEDEDDVQGNQIGINDPLNERILKITISDTGKGISRQYLRTSLFNPFCQEDVLASGTGLGLSIVRSIVTMLQGTIDVQSEVGVGTDVTIRLPLSRVPGADTPVTTPSSATEVKADDSMNALIRDHQGVRVGLVGFEIDKSGQGPVLKRCIEDWYGLHTTTYPIDTAEFSVDVLVVDERVFNNTLPYIPIETPTIVLCSNATRNQIVKRVFKSAILDFVSKPWGPHKVAKALRVCLDKAHDRRHGLSELMPPTLGALESPESDEATPMPNMDNLVLETKDESTLIEVQTNGVVTASGSQNAAMALDNSSSQTTSDDLTVTGNDFPFPIQRDENKVLHQSQAKAEPQAVIRPAPETRSTEPITKILVTSSTTDQGTNGTSNANAALARHPHPHSLDAAKTELRNDREVLSLTASNIALLNGDLPTPQTPQAKPVEHVQRPPKLLLVDDNKINLRLLETCMKKRKYQFVDTAEDGQLAVQAFEAHEDGYDVIFMDISMPVMNGFEATRAIRDIEDERGGKSRNGNERPPALIVALTGLASSRDQTEAFASGVDLFLTKPVSFKEVGKLLDNWEAHGGLKSPEEMK